MQKNFNPLVSIIIPVYNGSKYVREAIDSALAQTYKNIEVILVNDGSTDDTEKIVKSYGDKVRYFKKKNGGVATALNTGIKNAKGIYISWLSHDDIYREYKIQTQVESYSNLKPKDRKTTIFFANQDYINLDTNITTTPRAIEYGGPHKDKLFETLKLLFESKINFCSMLIPKEIFDKFGLFETHLKTTQDYAFIFKLIKSGINFEYTNEVLMTSRHHSQQGTHKLIDLHIQELSQLYIGIFDYYTSFFRDLPLWQLNIFLEVMKDRTLYNVYAHMLSKWAGNKGKSKIWLYWQNSANKTIPTYILLCWKTIVINNKNDYDIKILTDYDIESYLPGILQETENLQEIAHKADYIRFNLLYKYGGIWLDSDFICFKSLRPIEDQIKENGFVCTGYFHKSGKYFPLIAVLGAKPKNKICKNVINDMQAMIKNAKDQKRIIQWDEFGGWSLAKYINKNKYPKLILDNQLFAPIGINEQNTDRKNPLFQSFNNDISELINQHQKSYGQIITNSTLSEEYSKLTEEELMQKNTLISIQFSLGLGALGNIKSLIPYNKQKDSTISTQTLNMNPQSYRVSKIKKLKPLIAKAMNLLPHYRKLHNIDSLINARFDVNEYKLSSIISAQSNQDQKVEGLLKKIEMIEQNILKKNNY